MKGTPVARTPRLLLLFLAALLGAASLAMATPAADSVILFIGDGMGVAEIALGRAAAGGVLTLDRMPYSGSVTTVSSGGEVTDSGAASTALSSGYKTENGMLGMTPNRKRVETILERCRRAGKSVGLVTNESLTGATPAGFAVHVPDRDLARQIAEQLASSDAAVMMGYGSEGFVSSAPVDAAKGASDIATRLRKKGYDLVLTREELANSNGERLVGLFREGSEPELAEMVSAALARLRRNPKGFLLVVEQADVDGRPGDPSGAALDILELDRAAGTALEFARRQGRSLVLVTADHETGGLQIGNPGLLGALKGIRASAPEIAKRLNKDRSNVREVMKAEAGIADLSEAEVSGIKSAADPGGAIGSAISQRLGIKWTAGHTATPVRVFAYGPGADRFTGEMDNTDIPKRIAATLGLGGFGGPKQ
jgi:alkaline phosphatase